MLKLNVDFGNFLISSSINGAVQWKNNKFELVIFSKLRYYSFMIIEQKNDDQIKVQIFKALADESRLEIIRILRDQEGELSCGEIGEKINISKSTASYHFKTLREAGLTSTRKETRNKYVKLRLDTFEKYLPGFLDSL